MLINKTFAWQPGHISMGTTIAIVFMFCIIMAIMSWRRLVDAGMEKNWIIIVSAIPIIYFIPFIYLMLKPSSDKESVNK